MSVSPPQMTHGMATDPQEVTTFVSDAITWAESIRSFTRNLRHSSHRAYGAWNEQGEGAAS